MMLKQRQSRANTKFFKPKNLLIKPDRRESKFATTIDMKKSFNRKSIQLFEESTKIEEETKNNDFTKNKKSKIVEVMEELHNMISMIIIKFKMNTIEDTNYQPWDSVSIKCNKVDNIVKDFEKRKTITELTQKICFKSYPINFDSSNFDPIKSWICGIQIAAMNLQTTTDDFTIINSEFFKINRNSGYILKPDFLRMQTYNKTYSSPLFTLRFELLAGLMLQFLHSDVKCSNRTLRFETYVLGSLEDEKNNQRYVTSISHNFLNPKFEEQVYLFKIYEDILSFVFIKITVEEQLVGRCVIPLWVMCQGYRSITIYDNYGREFDDSLVICHVKRE
jgi:hypothetical protein